VFVQPLLQWKSNKYYTLWVCVFVTLLSTTQCAIPILSPVVCPALQYFPTLSLLNSYDFREKTLSRKCVFIFSTTFIWNISHSTNNSARYQTYIDLHEKHRLFLTDLMKLDSSQQNFEKYSNIKFHETPFSGVRVSPCERMLHHRISWQWSNL
jgi:hypothetical protein